MSNSEMPLCKESYQIIEAISQVPDNAKDITTIF